MSAAKTPLFLWVCIKKVSEGIYNKPHVSCIKRREWYDRTQTEVIVTDVNGNVAIDSVTMPNLAITNSLSFNGGSISHFADINTLVGITASTEELNRFNDYDTLVIADDDGKVTLMNAVTAQELIIDELRLKNLSYVPPRLEVAELDKRCFATRHSVTGKSEEECKAYLMEVKERGMHCVAGDGSTTEAASSEECEQSWMGLGTVTLAEYKPSSTTCSWCFGTTIMDLNNATIFSIAEGRYKGVTATGVLNMLQTFSAFDVNWVDILNNAGRGVVLTDENQKLVLHALSIAGTLTTSSFKVNETLMNHTALRQLQGIDDIKKLDDYEENILTKLNDVMTSDATTAQLNLAGAICGSCSDFRVKSKALCDGGFCVDDPKLSKADCPGAFIERVWTENDCESPANLLLQEVVKKLSEETCTKDHSYELLPNGCVDGDNVDGTITKTDCLFTFDNTTQVNTPCSTGEVTSYDKCLHTYDTYPGRCSDRSDKTEAECVSFCASGQSLENCGVCSCRRAANIYYNYTETTLHYSGTACLNEEDCQLRCTADSACEGYSERSPVSFNQKTIDPYDSTYACANTIIPIDLDDDGDMDLLTSCTAYDKIYYYENLDGQGTFSDRVEIATGVHIYNIYAADFNNDGHIDIVGGDSGNLYWFKNDGQGTFSRLVISNTNIDTLWDVYAADLDGDGDVDVLSASWYNSRLAWYENTDGQGTFSAEKLITGAVNPKDVYAADLDGDGYIDVLSGDNEKVAWYKNLDGKGTFSGAKTIDADPTKETYTADVDGDGDLDVLVATLMRRWGDSTEIAWYENLDGNGTFSNQKVITSDVETAQDVHAADLDGDGDMDVLSASYEDDKIAWYENLYGNGTFSDQRVLQDDLNKASYVVAADLNGDGVLDVVGGHGTESTMQNWYWYENEMEPPAYGPETSTGSGQGFKKVITGHEDVTCPSYIDGKSTCSNQCEDGGTEEAKCGTCSGPSSTFDTPICSNPNVPATPEACSGCLTADIPDDFTSHMPSSCGGSYDCLKDLTKDAEACAAAGHTWLSLTVPDGLSIIDNKAQCVGYCEYDRSKTKEECPTIETYQRSELMKYNSSGACINEEECVSKCNDDDNCKGYSQFCSEEEKTHSPCPVYCPTNENLAHYNFGMCGQCSDGVTDNNVTCTNGCGRCNDATKASSADCHGQAPTCDNDGNCPGCQYDPHNVDSQAACEVVKEVQNSVDYTCYVNGEDQLFCEGHNWVGRLGNGIWSERAYHTPQRVKFPTLDAKVKSYFIG